VAEANAMDRIEAMSMFITAPDEGSLATAARRLKRSPAAVSRAIAFLEARVGAQLLHRTTRSMGFSEAGERYAIACRRMLAELEEAEALAGGEQAAPTGILSISAPPISGEDVLRPILDDFLDAHPMVSARLLLLDRPVTLIEEGMDVAMRIAELPMIATRIGTDVRRVVVGSPAYLPRYPPITEPANLTAREIIAFTNFGIDSWSFAAAAGSRIPRVVHFRPRLTVNTVRAALASAIMGRGLTRLYSQLYT
jgi:DNA-binding transcriptional LysR family regulator